MTRGGRPRLLLALGAMGLGSLVACTEDAPPATSGPSTTSTTTATTTAPTDATLTPLLVTVDDLPAGFAPNADVDDTITEFCDDQDAAAGLLASERAIVGFRRTPAGASVIELVFRFEADGAIRFVAQAEHLLTACNEVPDATGLAFSYEPVGPEVAAALTGAESLASRYGVSIGSGNLTVDVAVLQRGDIGVLVAVLGLGQPRSELDALASTAFAAAVARLPAP